jgi:Flp pilus assembly protein TadG
MKSFEKNRSSERGGAGVKFLLIALALALVGNAGINYIPIAYEGANLRQEMDTAVVRGMAASGRLKPVDVVTASVQKALRENNVPEDAVVNIQVNNTTVQAHVVYTKSVSILPFGLYKYNYNFNYVAAPNGYLLKDGKV